MKIETGDVVLVGGSDVMWRYCLMHVVEVRSWGIVGTVTGPNGSAYPLRLAFGEVLATYKQTGDENL